METNETSLLGKVADATQSEIIFFFIILAVVLIVVMIPLYTLMLKDRNQKSQIENDKLKQYMEREKRIIEVITANTEVMSSLKTTLERDGAATTSSLGQINDRIISLSTAVSGVQITLDRAISNQTSMTDSLGKILLTVDNIPSVNDFSKREVIS